MRVELIVPLGLIVGAVHVECVMVDALIMPFTLLVKHKHFFRLRVRVDHVQIQALVLLEKGSPACSAPIVIFGNWNHLVDMDI